MDYFRVVHCYSLVINSTLLVALSDTKLSARMQFQRIFHTIQIYSLAILAQNARSNRRVGKSRYIEYVSQTAHMSKRHLKDDLKMS